MFVGIAVVVAMLLYLLGADEWFSHWITGVLPRDLSVYALLLLIALITSFGTEILSNTAVQVSMFFVASTFGRGTRHRCTASLISGHTLQHLGFHESHSYWRKRTRVWRAAGRVL